METRFAFVASLVVVALPAGLVMTQTAACGGSPDAVFQNGITEDAGQSPNAAFDGSLGPADVQSLAIDSGPCPPASVASFAPSWKPPSASKSGACNSTQISTFYDACLGPSSSANGCTAYVQANATCAACLQSDDTDPQYGPIIWHSNRTYYTTNIAGCIADEQVDAGTSGCGAAYQASVQCKETACAACLTVADPSPSRYAVCEEQAGSGGCSSFNADVTSACGSALSDPNDAVSTCIPPSGDTAEDAYLRLAPVFCGQ